jgi:hypothetical protein
MKRMKMDARHAHANKIQMSQIALHWCVGCIAQVDMRLMREDVRYVSARPRKTPTVNRFNVLMTVKVDSGKTFLVVLLVSARWQT